MTTTMTTCTPNTFIVGAGAVATALAGALRHGGVPVLGLWGRREEQARQAGAVSGVVAFSGETLPQSIASAQVVIVAVKDEAILEVSSRLVQEGVVHAQQVLLHCSGAVSAQEAFGATTQYVGGVATFHPLAAVTDGPVGATLFNGASFGIQGDERGKQIAVSLVQALGGRPLVLSGDQMASYHAAAALASNFLVTLLDAATGLLTRSGINRKEGLQALLTLAEGSLQRVREHGVDGGLTGPIRRGDTATIIRHLEALTPELQSLYRGLGLRTTAIARRLGMACGEDLEAIDSVLAADENIRREDSAAYTV